jgi:hypothetical protein
MPVVECDTYAEIVSALAAYNIADCADTAALSIEISDTLEITASVGGGIKGVGPGSSIASGSPGARTTLKWTGSAGGTMILADQWGAGFLENLALDGNNSAAVGVKITESAPFGTSQLLFRRLAVRNFTTAGFDVGVDGQPNCSDMTFDNVWFYNCGIGVRVNNEQGVNFFVAGGGAQSVGTIFDFVKGGNLSVFGSPHYGGFDLMLSVQTGGPNAAMFRFDSVRAEMGGYENRYAKLVEATSVDQCFIAIHGLQETGFTLNEELVDNETDPLFEIGAGVTLDLFNHKHREGRVILSRSGGMFRDTYGIWSAAPSTEDFWTGTGTGILVTRASNSTGERLESFARSADEEI